jgi:hypothetical protein
MSQPVLEERSKKPGRPDYKAKLDEAADREKSPSQQQQSTGVIEKGRCMHGLGLLEYFANRCATSIPIRANRGEDTRGSGAGPRSRAITREERARASKPARERRANRRVSQGPAPQQKGRGDRGANAGIDEPRAQFINIQEILNTWRPQRKTFTYFVFLCLPPLSACATMRAIDIGNQLLPVP